MTDKPQQEEEEKFSENEKRRWAELEEKERRRLQASNGHVEEEAAEVYEHKDKVETNTADVNSNRQSKSIPKPPFASDSFPQDINNRIAKLKIVIDHIDSPRNFARDLIHELARQLDERRLCERNQISRRIKKILEDKIQDGKITKEWISECLPEDYKRKYTKCKLSLLSKPEEDKDTEQDPAESAEVQEPWLKRELLAQTDTSGHSIQQQQPSEPSQLETDTTQQPGGNDTYDPYLCGLLKQIIQAQVRMVRIVRIMCIKVSDTIRTWIVGLLQ